MVTCRCLVRVIVEIFITRRLSLGLLVLGILGRALNGIVVRLVGDMMIVVALLNLVEGLRISDRSGTFIVTKNQLDIIHNITFARGNVGSEVLSVRGVESHAVVEGFSTDRGEINPNLGLVGLADRICKVDLVSTLVYAVCFGRDLDGNSRIGAGPVTPWFLVPTT